MNKIRSTMLWLGLTAWSTNSLAANGTFDVGSYLQQQGWKRYDTTSLPRSPVPDVVPLMFYEKGNSVPSCGLLTAAVGSKATTFIALVGSDPGVGFPQCLAITAMTPFNLQNKEYLVVEYLSRETREDVDRHLHYLVRSDAQGFVTDKLLTDAAPVTSAEAKSPNGVRFARLFQLAKAQPAWQLVERDFISDKSSSFATFENKKASGCQFITEAGAAPVVTFHTAFTPSAKCDSVLASSRFEKSGKVYYLALYRTSDNQRFAGVTSVAADGHIAVEKTLSAFINQSGVTSDLKTVRTALMKEVQ